jgi:hypothetical protein
LTVPVVALVRYASEMVGAFEGPDPNVTVMQKSLTLGPDGIAQTWVHIPAGYWAVHGAMGVVGASADLQDPSIDIGADGFIEWAFSGKFDIGVLVNNIEDAFNDYILSQGSGASDINVPIIIRANASETIQLNGIQLYLDSKVGDFEPDGDVDWFDLAKFVSHWLEQDCNDPNWCEGTDINHSNTVDFADFAFFAENWFYQTPALPMPDFDHDDDVDFDDLNRLTNYWLSSCNGPFWCDGCDINKSGSVNFIDFASFANDWLKNITP